VCLCVSVCVCKYVSVCDRTITFKRKDLPHICSDVSSWPRPWASRPNFVSLALRSSGLVRLLACMLHGLGSYVLGKTFTAKNLGRLQQASKFQLVLTNFPYLQRRHPFVTGTSLNCGQKLSLLTLRLRKNGFEKVPCLCPWPWP